jgi:hypothetical protein
MCSCEGKAGRCCACNAPSVGDAGAVGSPLLPCCAGDKAIFSVLVLGVEVVQRPLAEVGRERKESQT